MILGLATVLLAGLAVWLALTPQTRFHFGTSPTPTWKSIVIAITQAVEKQTAEPIRHAADALGWPPSRIAAGCPRGCQASRSATASWRWARWRPAGASVSRFR